MYDERLVLDNIKLIYAVLKKLKVYHKCDEYFDVGMIGLVKGAKSFNKDLGYSPTTYLYKCIYNEIVKEFKKKEISTISLDKPIDDLHTFEDIIPDKKTTESDYFSRTDNIIINETIKELTPKEQMIIYNTFGFFEKKMTQQELGEKLGVCQARISRIKTSALKKLKIKLEGKL